jgi:hypothetical protein
MDRMSRIRRYFRERSYLRTVSWRKALLVLVVVYVLAVVPAVEFLLRGTGAFATFMVAIWIGLGMATFVFVDCTVAWIRFSRGTHSRRMLRIAVSETLILVLVVAWLFGRY